PAASTWLTTDYRKSWPKRNEKSQTIEHMKKRNRIIYWVATIWLGLGMASTGLVQLIGIQEEKDMMEHLGYPMYFLTLIGVWKLLGVVAVLIPKAPLLKEWAYAGFAFVMTGAMAS